MELDGVQRFRIQRWPNATDPLKSSLWTVVEEPNFSVQLEQYVRVCCIFHYCERIVTLHWLHWFGRGFDGFSLAVLCLTAQWLQLRNFHIFRRYEQYLWLVWPLQQILLKLSHFNRSFKLLENFRVESDISKWKVSLHVGYLSCSAQQSNLTPGANVLKCVIFKNKIHSMPIFTLDEGGDLDMVKTPT